MKHVVWTAPQLVEYVFESPLVRLAGLRVFGRKYMGDRCPQVRDIVVDLTVRSCN